MPTLVIGNKIYSSWSMRPWLLMRHHGVAFDEILIPLDHPNTKDSILEYSPAGKVPVLVEGETIRVWESIAIIDYVADLHPDLPIWPKAPEARALARSIAAEMHGGFAALRKAMPVNIGKRFAHRDRGEAVERDIARVIANWREARDRFGAGGPFLFGADFGGADAMYAPVVTRLDTYSYPVDPDVRAYMDAVLALPAYREWLAEALKEPWTTASDEIDEVELENFRARR